MTFHWWQMGVVYQIYPRSFQDTDANGIGDLAGIIQRLDHLVALGVDAVWLSPIFPSPMADFGYDISNFIDIAAVFGTLEQFDALSAEVKRRGLKLLLDYVPNHTSMQHPWFEQARASRNNPKRDWYLWHDPVAGGPPNNWLSNFGGSAWEWDAPTQQYYYHSFLKEQPDLNWRNPEVVAAMHEVLRFWLRRGVDGFRIDVLWLLIKDEQWRDNPANPTYRSGAPLFDSQLPLYTSDRPEVQDVVAGLRSVADEFDDRVLIGEIYLPLDRLMKYYGTRLDGVQLPFNFQLLLCAWNAREIESLINSYESQLPPGGWPNWVLGNHDRPRVASRVGAAQARIAAMLLLTLRGTPTMYYGDELGMHNVAIAPDRVQDPLEKNVPGQGLGRDPCRTPMQWDGSTFAGFSTVEPWLPLAEDHAITNVRHETEDSGSMLSLYRRLLSLRRKHSALSQGSYQSLPAEGNLLLYVRQTPTERMVIALNLGSTATKFSWPSSFAVPPTGSLPVLLSTSLTRTSTLLDGPVELGPDEGIILDMSTTPHVTA
jgi:alpha-glucosidase